ncbi:MAG: tetratricopeptide repeat protein [Verrucomicrobia bacterium]|nr:tetratricopeptide repeat protein [Verrucomicrobiota bacterium]
MMNRAWVLAMSVLLSVWVSVSCSNREKLEEQVHRLVDLSREQYAAKDYETAVTSAEKALAIAPDYIYAHLSCGFAASQSSNHARAVTAYTAAISLTDDKSLLYGVYGLRGNEYDTLGDFAAAIADYSTALELARTTDISDEQLAIRTPDDLHSSRGLAFLRTNQYTEAISDLSIAVAGSRSNAWHAWGSLCLAYRGIEDWDNAILAIKRCIEIEEETGDAHLELADILLTRPNPSTKDVREAQILIARAVELDPQLSEEATEIRDKLPQLTGE